MPETTHSPVNSVELNTAAFDVVYATSRKKRETARVDIGKAIQQAHEDMLVWLLRNMKQSTPLPFLDRAATHFVNSAVGLFKQAKAGNITPSIWEDENTDSLEMAKFDAIMAYLTLAEEYDVKAGETAVSTVERLGLETEDLYKKILSSLQEATQAQLP